MTTYNQCSSLTNFIEIYDLLYFAWYQMYSYIIVIFDTNSKRTR